MRFVELLYAVAEEYHEDIGPTTVGQQIANERGVPRYNLDITADERHAAGILEELRNRPEPKDAVCFRLPADDIREDAWMQKLTGSGLSGTTIVICGFLHYEALVSRLRAQTEGVTARVYLPDHVPVIKKARQK